MRTNHVEVHGPHLSDVLAFTMLEPLDDVARVHSTAAMRLSKGNPWSLCRVIKVDISDELDDLVRVRVTARCVSDVYTDSRERVFEFVLGNDKRSHRFDAFLASAGVSERVDEKREIEGRCFAVRNRGASVSDFGTLEDFLFPTYRVAA